jgi:heme/copper-type cytochrome/quinol oxidase subunit 2
VLAPVMLVMASAFGLALLAMSASMAAAGVEIALVELVLFSAMALIFLVATVHMLSSVRRRAGAAPADGRAMRATA